MAMKTEYRVKEMLAKFDEVDEGGMLDEGGEGVRDALLWVLGNGRSDSDLEEYLEDL